MNGLKYFMIAIMVAGSFILFTGCEKKEPAGAAILDSSVIRSGDTDIASLDENDDGMLFQCPMHYEVISDIEGRCPRCKMFLESYPVENARDNFHNMGHPL
jgi:hypothetical protein